MKQMYVKTAYFDFKPHCGTFQAYLAFLQENCRKFQCKHIFAAGYQNKVFRKGPVVFKPPGPKCMLVIYSVFFVCNVTQCGINLLTITTCKKL